MSFTYGNKNRMKFNGRDLQGLQIYCIDDDIVLENQFGVNQSVNMSDGVLIDVEKENFTFSLRFITRFNGVPSTLDTLCYGVPLLQELSRVFFNTDNDGVNILSIGDKQYYVVPIEGTLTRHSKNLAEFSVKFKSLSPYAYSPIMVNSIVVNTDNTGKEIEITNKGIDTYIEFNGECVGEGNVTITNITNGSSITVECNKGDSFTVDGESCDISGVDFDRVQGSIIDTLGLCYGKNKFRLETNGEFKLSTSYQMAFGVY